MADKVKGIVVEIGGDTSGLSKALKSLNKDIGSTQSELKKVDRLLKMDPGNTELLRQKQQLLAESIEETEAKVKALKSAKAKADAEMEKGTEINQKQYREMTREIISSESSLSNLRAEAKKTDAALNGIDDKPIEEVERAAKDAGDAIEDAGKQASSFGDFLNAGAVIEGVKGVASAISNLQAESLEYRKIMGTLEVSSANAGYTADQTKQSYQQLYGVLGDDQTAATTVANLQALGLSQSDLTSMIDGTIGAWAKYGDSIPIDSLAEAMNETIKTGNVTGTFADVLNWAGTSEDAFNEKLQAASSETERANLVLQELSRQGLMGAGKEWQTVNSDIVDANNAQADFSENAAELSERVSPIATKVKEGFNDIAEAALDATSGIDTKSVVDGIDNVFNSIQKLVNFLLEHKEAVISVVVGIGAGFAAWKIGGIISAVISSIKGFSSALNVANFSFKALNSTMKANVIILIVTIIAELVAALITLWNTNEGFRNAVISAWEAVSSAFHKAWDAIVTFFKETLPNAWNSVVAWVNGIPAWWNALWQRVGDFFAAVWDNIIAFFTETIPQQIENVKQWFSELPEKIGYFLGQVVARITNFGLECWNWVTNELPKIIAKIIEWFSQLPGRIKEWLINAYNNIVQWGKDTYNSMKSNVVNAINVVIEWFSMLPQKVKEWLNNVISKIKSWGAELCNSASNAAKSAVSSIVNWFSDLPSKIYDTGKNIVKKLWDGIVGMKNWLWDKVSGFFDGFLGGFVEGLISNISGGESKKSRSAETETQNAIPMLASGGTVLSGSAIVGEAGPELLTVSPYGTRVQPLSRSESAKPAGVMIERMEFYGYKPNEGRQIAREINIALGRSYA